MKALLAIAIASATVPAIGPSASVEPPEDLIAARIVWGTSAQRTKLSAAHPNPSSSFSFAVIGDAEPGRFFWQRWWNPGKDAFKRHLAKIHSQNPDFIFQLGDFVSKGTVKNYRNHVATLLANVRLPIFHVIGNHDRAKPNGPADKTLYKTLFGPGDFHIDHKGWRFIALDSSDYGVTDEQLDWLDRTLNTDMPTMVFTHIVPNYLKGQLKSVNPKAVSTKGALIPEAYFDQGSARFRKIVKAHNVRRVYMGHIHALGTAEVDGIRYVLSGGGGSPLYPLPKGYPKSKPAHFIAIDVNGARLVETVYQLDGSVYPLGF
jgi:predicted phosphodiesterase